MRSIRFLGFMLLLVSLPAPSPVWAASSHDSGPREIGSRRENNVVMLGRLVPFVDNRPGVPADRRIKATSSQYRDRKALRGPEHLPGSPELDRSRSHGVSPLIFSRPLQQDHRGCADALAGMTRKSKPSDASIYRTISSFIGLSPRSESLRSLLSARAQRPTCQSPSAC